MRVLVTGTSTFFTPRLIQGFRTCQASVTAADDHWWSIGKSIPQTRWLRTPSLSRDPAGYLAALVRELKSRPYDLLLPTFEESLLLSEFRSELESQTQLFLPDFDVMWQVHHKPSLYKLCCELRIPTPPTVTHPVPSNLEEQVRDLEFPVVVKLPGGNNCDGMQYCESMPELQERFTSLYLRETRKQADPPFVQQKITGDSIYTLMLCHAGRKLGEVIYRPLRTFPEKGGTSSHRESIVHPEIAKLTERLAAATGWSGFLGLDFIVDRTDGTPHLIDANPRANPAVQLGYLAGVDWTGLLIAMTRGRQPEPMLARAGVRCKTPLLDTLWLMEGLLPRRQWGATLLRRIRQVYKPDWSLDSSHDFLGRSEWLGHIAIGWQGAGAMIKSLVTGEALGQAFLSGANYDPLPVRRLREAILPGNGD
ncbi:MAG: ATP-grasp protein, partial [Planctomycetaceae bacterium]|nr:ATP-grasp protein [Planctomycetaceae bacterium]